MKPAAILETMWSLGLTVTLLEGDRLLVSPASSLHDAQRELLRTHKPELVAFLHDAHATTMTLIDAAMNVCDQHGDGQEAREEMRRDCLALPPHLQADLLDHFRGKRANLSKGAAA